jgi:hypothetical protein
MVLSPACVGEDTLGAFVEGRLLAEDAALVQGHLAECLPCREIAAAAREMLGGSGDDLRLSPGTRVGRYEIVHWLGAGAMGTVYAAHDPDLDRRVALKLLRADVGSDPLRARLSREAKAMARLSHPNVMTVHDVGAHGSRFFVAMELVAGGTLRGWLAERPRSWREVVGIFTEAGRGLASAHSAGLVHRDFKPDNVLVGSDGRVRVTDFGLARALRSEGEPDHGRIGSRGPGVDALGASITRTGALIGTPAYMAPEQLRGETADARSDLFSFCVALYEALFGERPFDGPNIPALRRATEAGEVRSVPAGSEVPSAVRDVVLTGLRPNPADRPDSMARLLDDLEAGARADAGSGPEATVRPPSRGDVMDSHVTTLGEALLPLVAARPRRGPHRALVVTAGVLGLAAVAVVATWSQRATDARSAAAATEAPVATSEPVAPSVPVDLTPPEPPATSSARPAATVPVRLQTRTAAPSARAKEAAPAPSQTVRPRPNPYEHM